ncbi:MAG: hypothetical protein IJX91_02675 [Clostridia bacterium]|nr:hypothetical protein [Clostridia bacterium]
MRGTKLLKRIGACVLAGVSFTLVACDEFTSSGSSNGGSLNKDEITLEAVCAVLKSYGVVEA